MHIFMCDIFFQIKMKAPATDKQLLLLTSNIRIVIVFCDVYLINCVYKIGIIIDVI